MPDANAMNNSNYQFSFMKLAILIFFLILVGVTAGTYMSDSSQVITYKGGCGQQSSPFLESRQGDYLITYCDGGDSYVGSVETNIFVPQAHVLFH